ncbi:MAG: hypothetical protein K0S55_930 [Clostridia bacterium]|nr:hypothetical protein [Clostridia bacterium]
MYKKKFRQIGLFIAAVFIMCAFLFNLAACNEKTENNEDPAEIENTSEDDTTKEDDNSDEGDSSIDESTENVEETLAEGNPYSLDTFKQSVVSVVQSDTVAKAEDLTQDDITALVKQAIEAAGSLEGVVKDGDVVVLKPNLVTGSDYTLPGWRGKPLALEVNGNCTDYRFVRAVAIAVREVNPSGKIYVIEGSAQDTKEVMKNLNYSTEFVPEVDAFYALEDISGEWQEKDADELVKVTLEDGYLHKEYYINRMIYEADAFICLPTMKNHWNACVTGSIKNIGIGSTPSSIYGVSEDSNGRNNMVNHDNMDLHKWIADFFTCRPADFTVTDGLQGLEFGPTPCYDAAGISDIKTCQMNMRMVLAGRDAVAVDTVQSEIMNWDPYTVGYLTLLDERGIGNIDAADIIVTGNRTVSQVRTDFENTKPTAGGEMVKDLTPPEAPKAEAAFATDKDDGMITITQNVDLNDVVKLEYYVDGALKSVFSQTAVEAFDYSLSDNIKVNVVKEGSEIKINAADLAAGEHTITVAAYDKYMNRSETVIKVTK